MSATGAFLLHQFPQLLVSSSADLTIVVDNARGRGFEVQLKKEGEMSLSSSHSCRWQPHTSSRTATAAASVPPSPPARRSQKASKEETTRWISSPAMSSKQQAKLPTRSVRTGTGTTAATKKVVRPLATTGTKQQHAEAA
ncbi:expressed unknown protein [Seminavis robusta]|uniref:Uncharacterized protein n=1 Tax=Seminavis robusta TaxID=568900 RepID=A0A9N8F2W8_9STRA|nr:expressed unknown protein [Seminavis robusta]|eukprot:Sro2589_g332030.1 n/a (140) ;mRNA; f:3085-3504